MKQPAIGDPRLPDKFWAHVAMDERGCWRWSPPRQNGYGVMHVDRKQKYAHRLAYEALVGAIPAGLEIDHLCRVRNCVNPAHLEPVTLRVNSLRGQSFAARNWAKSHCKNGHPFSEQNTWLRRLPSGNVSRVCKECHSQRLAAAKRGAKANITPQMTRKPMAVMTAGRRFGRLVTVERAHAPGEQPKWLCLCDCGASKRVDPWKLKTGNTSSCGCFQREARTRRHRLGGDT